MAYGRQFIIVKL